MNVEVRRIHPTEAKKIRDRQRLWAPSGPVPAGRDGGQRPFHGPTEERRDLVVVQLRRPPGLGGGELDESTAWGCCIPRDQRDQPECEWLAARGLDGQR